MASFAKIGLNNIVITVESVSNNVLNNPATGQEEEERGLIFLRNLYNEPEAVWKQTSYNTMGGVHKLGGTPFRKNHAGIGHTYDQDKDAFIPIKPTEYSSWVLNNTTCQWEPPVSKPTEVLPANQGYSWNEDTLTWDIVTYDDLGLVIN
jgi:hypothetical protein|tara:strand:+ start:130 stop:576 length:447 start_codon:yes stop_codon:yes gene_type:complete